MHSPVKFSSFILHLTDLLFLKFKRENIDCVQNCIFIQQTFTKRCLYLCCMKYGLVHTNMGKHGNWHFHIYFAFPFAPKLDVNCKLINLHWSCKKHQGHNQCLIQEQKNLSYKNQAWKSLFFPWIIFCSCI